MNVRLMNGNLPDANEGAGWRFVRTLCCWQRSRGRAAGQTVALRRPSARTNFRGGAHHCDWARCAVEVELVRGREGWLPWRGLVAAAWVGCRGVGWLPRRGLVAVAWVGCRGVGWLPCVGWSSC